MEALYDTKNCGELKLRINLYELEKDMNCIIIERIYGDKYEFVQRYDDLKRIVNEEL